jgi:hypothetical protein
MIKIILLLLLYFKLILSKEINKGYNLLFKFNNRNINRVILMKVPLFIKIVKDLVIFIIRISLICMFNLIKYKIKFNTMIQKLRIFKISQIMIKL